MKLVNLSVCEQAKPVVPERMRENWLRWLMQVQELCEECDCHANAVVAAAHWRQSFGTEDMHVVTGVVRERTEEGWSFDHSWIRVGSRHLDPTAELFWPAGQRDQVIWVPIIERAQPAAGALPARSLAHALADVVATGKDMKP